MATNPLNNLNRYDILLASHSPRRRELLQMIGIDFSIAATIDVDESYPDDMPAHDVAPFLSDKKAEAYRAVMLPDQLIITADTVVINKGTVLGKPHSEENAHEMLRELSGHTHEVVTGVTISTIKKHVTLSACTKVEFADLTSDEIDFYVTRYRPLDKAGAYGIQEWIGAIGVKSISGSYYNVMGLPLHRLYNELREF